jgi:retinol-binding protein 3
MTREHRPLLPSACALLLAIAAFAEPSRPISWPDSPAGRAASAYFAMFADGSEAAIRSFETAYRSSAALAQVPIELRVRRAQDLRFRFGALTPVRVEPIDAQRLRVVATAADANVELEFDMEPHEPAKLAGIVVAVAGPDDTIAHASITAEERDRAVEEVATAVADKYVYPDVGRAMAEKLRQAKTSGAYSAITDDGTLARRLTDDLRAVKRDLHLRVRVAPPEVGGPRRLAGPPDDGARSNFGFRRVELLDGNIGLVRLDGFMSSSDALQTADAAMAFLKHADSLIFDLRRNSGGDPVMIQRLASYLFEERTHLNSMVDRNGAVVDDFWTGNVPGARFRADLPIFVLTSADTFSCAEEFTYDLKNLRRATIVGETTGGGAHPVMSVPAGGRFVVMVPFLRALNPITQTNWEGVGVEPDVKTSADEALDRALALARGGSQRTDKSRTSR